MNNNGWTRNLSVRVPWQDRQWDGHVCSNPSENSSCIALKLIAENRKDDVENSMRDKPFEDLSLNDLPPCIKSSASFLSPKPQKFESRMPYVALGNDHNHILPHIVEIPAWGATIIPYKWMLKEHGFDIASDLEIPASESNEPREPSWLAETDWVQGFDNQRELLTAFGKPLKVEESLVLFYADRTPLSDDDRRVLLGAAILKNKSPLVEYPYKQGTESKLKAMVWDRPIQHSLRYSSKDNMYVDGFVMPYHQLLSNSGDISKHDLTDYITFVPNDVRPNFSYYSEHISHGITASVLLLAKNSLEKIGRKISGPWSSYISWIDSQVSRLLTLQGPVPGLGTLLSAFHDGFHGTLFAISIEDSLKNCKEPWELIDSIFCGKLEQPAGSPKITNFLRKKWNKLIENEDKFSQFKLLARFELTKEQASRALKFDASQILNNPYILFEQDRLNEIPISFATIDRGLHPGRELTDEFELPQQCDSELTEHDNEKRLRASCVEILEKNSLRGHTFLPATELESEVQDMGVNKPIPLNVEAVEIFHEHFSEVLEVIGEGDKMSVQLERYDSTKKIIEDAIKYRIETPEVQRSINWLDSVNKKFENSGLKDNLEDVAREEKAIALSKLASSKIGVLIGPAGTGKTSVLQLLLSETKIVGDKVTLLAPTGKARVRLSTDAQGHEVKTVAQFLLKLERFNPVSGQYFVNPKADKEYSSTCIVDESSMLTEEMLAALIDTLSEDCRLILVGDPYQLPPIGAGCPFVDIIKYLKEEANNAGVAELFTIRRQVPSENKIVGGLNLVTSRLDVQLASLFSGREKQEGEEEIIKSVLTGQVDDTIKFVEWENVSDLSDKLIQAMSEEIDNLSRELKNFANTDDPIDKFECSLGATPNENYINFVNNNSSNLENWQILSVNRNLPGGSIYLNRLIKEKFRSKRLNWAVESRLKPRFLKIYRTIEPRGLERITYGDKVICVRNHLRKYYSIEENRQSAEKVFLANGEIGIVLGENSKKRIPSFTQVEFANRGNLNFSFFPSEFKEEAKTFLELAYAITVHKAQGSEFGSVILVLPSNSRLISREMIYTALTRQKKRIWVLHQGDINHFLKFRDRDPSFSAIENRYTNLLSQRSI